jgi:acyl dehydratase
MALTVTQLNSLEELVGQSLGPTDWLEMAQDRVNLFADATDDHQWIHTDVERAKAGPFGAPIAHGYLTLSMVIPLWAQLLSIEGVGMAVNYGLNRVRFISPVPAGSRIRLAASISEVKQISGGCEVIVDATVELEGAAKPACALQAVFRYLAAPA